MNRVVDYNLRAIFFVGCDLKFCAIPAAPFVLDYYCPCYLSTIVSTLYLLVHAANNIQNNCYSSKRRVLLIVVTVTNYDPGICLVELNAIAM